MENNMNRPAVVKIGQGSQLHLAQDATRPVAFCKGLRTHRAYKVGEDLSLVTCAKCKARIDEDRRKAEAYQAGLDRQARRSARLQAIRDEQAAKAAGIVIVVNPPTEIKDSGGYDLNGNPL